MLGLNFYIYYGTSGNYRINQGKSGDLEEEQNELYVSTKQNSYIISYEWFLVHLSHGFILRRV